MSNSIDAQRLKELLTLITEELVNNMNVASWKGLSTTESNKLKSDLSKMIESAQLNGDELEV